MRISLIAAIDKNRVIGQDGGLPWHLPEDFAWFKKITTGKPVLMGRKTFESIGRPLPQRTNIVISRHAHDTPGVTWVTSLEAALEKARHQHTEEIMIIGGGEIYRQALPHADRLYLTEVDIIVRGDSFFPDFHAAEWQRTVLSTHTPHDTMPGFTIVQYDRLLP